ncbi:hypothetical protein Tco_0363814 [Tanacetum coccineum]
MDAALIVLSSDSIVVSKTRTNGKWLTPPFPKSIAQAIAAIILASLNGPLALPCRFAGWYILASLSKGSVSLIGVKIADLVSQSTITQIES